MMLLLLAWVGNFRRGLERRRFWPGLGRLLGARFLFRLDHGVNAAVLARQQRCRRGSGRAAVHQIGFVLAIIGDVLAAHFVVAALDVGALEEFGLIALAVIDDALGLAVDVFVLALAALAEA